MTSKDSSARHLVGQFKKIPTFFKSAPVSPSDLALLAFNFRHRNEKVISQPLQSRRAKAVSEFRQKKREVKIDLGSITSESDHNFYRGFSNDVEDGGVFVATFDCHPIGTAVAMRFELGDDYAVEAKGVVEFVREKSRFIEDDNVSGMGIRFNVLENDDKTAIEQFQAEKQPLFFEM